MSGKRLLVRMSNKIPGMYELHYEDGGELPDDFKGAGWTHRHLAEASAKSYLENKGAKSGNTKRRATAN